MMLTRDKHKSLTKNKLRLRTQLKPKFSLALIIYLRLSHLLQVQCLLYLLASTTDHLDQMAKRLVGRVA